MKKQVNPQLSQEEFFFQKVSFTEWYSSYNLSPKSSNLRLFWWWSNFSKSWYLKNTTLSPMQLNTFPDLVLEQDFASERLINT